MDILLSDAIRRPCPALCVGVLEATVVNSEYDADLWTRIGETEADVRQRLTTETLKLQPGIRATREAYKVLGKDPSRYRPSNEQLVRRVLQGKELYQINTLVDINNLASIRWGYSIGGFDVDCIQGTRLTLGVGRAGEPYEGIGRGPLNIEGLPVYRDAAGGIGTPTSDHERTKLSLSTTRLLFLINAYDGDVQQLRRCGEDLQQLLREFARSDGGTFRIIED